jgi:hypothetical protein
MDRWLVRKMVAVVGHPPVRIYLWDGKEVTPECEHPLAELVYADRAALLKTIINPELYWGDLYCTGRVTFECNLPRFLEAIYRGIRSLGKPGPVRRYSQPYPSVQICTGIERVCMNVRFGWNLTYASRQCRSGKYCKQSSSLLDSHSYPTTPS